MPDQMLASNEANYNVPTTPRTIHGNDQPVAPMPPNTIRSIQINQLNRGYVVVVGCQSFAIENSSTLIAKLAEYINSPAATEQKWNEWKLF